VYSSYSRLSIERGLDHAAKRYEILPNMAWCFDWTMGDVLNGFLIWTTVVFLSVNAALIVDKKIIKSSTHSVTERYVRRNDKTKCLFENLDR
jgi:hypothetical protein